MSAQSENEQWVDTHGDRCHFQNTTWAVAHPASHQRHHPQGEGTWLGQRASCAHLNFQTAAVSDPINLRNAKNAILEELPRIVNTMALIWNVLRKEETQKRPVDLLGATKGSSSVYFKTTKVRPWWVCWSVCLQKLGLPCLSLLSAGVSAGHPLAAPLSAPFPVSLSARFGSPCLCPSTQKTNVAASGNQMDLHNEFQANQGYIARPCLSKQRKKCTYGNMHANNNKKCLMEPTVQIRQKNLPLG